MGSVGHSALYGIGHSARARVRRRRDDDARRRRETTTRARRRARDDDADTEAR